MFLFSINQSIKHFTETEVKLLAYFVY